MFEVLIILGVLLLLGILFIPVTFRFFFTVNADERFIELRIFRKKIYRLNAGESEETQDNPEDEAEDASEPETKETAKAKPPEQEVHAESEPPGDKDIPETPEIPFDETTEKPKKKKSKKRKLSEREILTLALQPDFDRKVLKKGFALLKSFFRIFRAGFDRTVVKGVHFNYAVMGISQGLFGAFTAMMPLFKNWELHMDWAGQEKLGIDGSFRVRITGVRICEFLCRTLAFAGWLFFWYRKNKKELMKNPSQFKLVFWRRWILNLLASEKKDA